MLTDSHIHLGKWYDNYLSPYALKQFINRIGLSSVAVSSTSICTGNYELALDEMKTILRIANFDIAPTLWISSDMIKKEKLSAFTSSNIKWRCVKIHPILDKNYWLSDNNIDIAVNIAKQFECPILIHTGETENCYPEQYENIIRYNKDIHFILAHGRPIKQSKKILIENSNALVDTAFMPLKDILLLCSEGLSHKTLWGSDYPVDKYYRKLFYNFYYRRNLLMLKRSLSTTEYNNITFINFHKTFSHE